MVVLGVHTAFKCVWELLYSVDWELVTVVFLVVQHCQPIELPPWAMSTYDVCHLDTEVHDAETHFGLNLVVHPVIRD